MTTKTSDFLSFDEEEEVTDFLPDDLELENNSGSKKTSTKKGDDEIVEFSKTKIKLIQKLLQSQKENLENLNNLLSGVMTDEEARIGIGQLSEKMANGDSTENEGQIIEGVFDGESMIGPDGKQYSVPANYASKSKLVEGDILKLTITSNGTFVYKQIGPIERNRVVGELEQLSNGNFIVRSEGRTWHVLTASVTYYKGQTGDEIIILVPKASESKWAAVENIVRQ